MRTSKFHLSLLMLVWSITTFSQTQLIAYKSHSGNLENFSAAYDQSLFDMDHHHFGEYKLPMMNKVILDSLILLSDTSAVMITNRGIMVKEASKIYMEKWFIQRDTLYHDPVMNTKSKTAVILNRLKSHQFDNKVKTVKIVDLQNGKYILREKKNEPPVLIPPSEPGNPSIWWTGLLIISCLGGWITHRYQPMKVE